MRLEYRLTADDVRDAAQPARADGRLAGGNRLTRGVLGWGVFLALGLATVYLLTLPSPPRRTRVVTPDPLPPVQNLWVTLVPTVVPAGFMLMVIAGVVAQQAARGRQVTAAMAAGRPVPPPPTGRTLGRWFAGGVVGLMLLAGTFAVPAVAIPWRPTPAMSVGVGLAPAIVTLVVLIATLGASAQARRRWAALPSAHRPLTVDVSGDGVRTTDGVCDGLYRWPAIVRYRETQTVLALTLEDGRLLVLPKRAVPDPADAAALRGLVQTHVATGTFLPQPVAFPVLPVGD